MQNPVPKGYKKYFAMALVVNAALFIGAVAVIAVAVKWALS
jgi:hypothetical protein